MLNIVMKNPKIKLEINDTQTLRYIEIAMIPEIKTVTAKIQLQNCTR